MATYSGHVIKLSVFGASREPSVGLSIEGIPAGEQIDCSELQSFLDRRAPGRFAWTTARKEPDVPQFLSGLCDGVTTGEPITAVLPNTDAAKEEARTVLRPGHADWPAYLKYGEIPAGGGKFSGRLTAPFCVAGGICLQFLKKRGIAVAAHAFTVADVQDLPFDPMQPELDALCGKEFPTLDDQAGEQMIARILEAKELGNSVGGIIECAVTGLPAGLGDHLWEGLESRISMLVFGVPGIKGVQFGSGFAAAILTGADNNDPLCIKDGKIAAMRNCSGGILGGMTTGQPLLFAAAVKPTPTVGVPQKTVDVSTFTETEASFEGRNDPCIVPRAVPVIEAAAAIALYDAILENT